MGNKLGILCYVAPPNLANADSFFANMRKCPAKNRLLLYSDHDYSKEWPGIFKLNGTVEVAKTDKNKMAVNNLVFFTGLRLAANYQFTHVMIVEHDCRVSTPAWDETIWQEFLSKNPDAIMGGTMVFFNPCSFSRQAAERYELMVVETKPKRLMPFSTCGTSDLARKYNSCIFPNGAFAIYRMDWLLKTFPEIIGTPEQYISLAMNLKTWDYAIGVRLWNEFKEDTYEKVVNLESVYSGYGNIMCSEEERRQWLEEGKIVGVHQIKSTWAGPVKKAVPVIMQPKVEKKTRLFIVTYAKDFVYLEYCLRSIQKFATGFVGTTILVPTKDVPALRIIINNSGIKNVIVKSGYEWAKKGMLWHLVQKCRADEWCPDADYIAHFDADCVFTSPVTPETFFKDGKPLLRYEPFATLSLRQPNILNWKAAAERCLPFTVNNEGMRGHPEVYHRTLYAKTRELVEQKTKLPFNDFVKSTRNEFPQEFCEFVTLSAVAQELFKDNYFFVDLSKEPNPDKSPYPVCQFWSHGEITKPQTIWIDGKTKEVTPKILMEEILKINLLTDKHGWQFAVIKGDTHAAKWCEEQQRLDYDRSVEDVLQYIKPGDTVIDVGANIGAYTVSMAKAVGETGRVFAFEPNLAAYVCLEINCRDLPQATLFNEGLSDVESFAGIEQEKNAGASHIISCSNGTVKMITLDDINLPRCDFIKMDVEGYEPFVIRGAMKTLKKFRPKMFVELNDGPLARYGFTKQDILKPLFDVGYILKFIDPRHNLNYEQLDVLLIPR